MTYANIQNYCFKGFTTKYSVANTLCLIISNLISWLTDKRILFQWHCHWHCLFQILAKKNSLHQIGYSEFPPTLAYFEFLQLFCGGCTIWSHNLWWHRDLIKIENWCRGEWLLMLHNSCSLMLFIFTEVYQSGITFCRFFVMHLKVNHTYFFASIDNGCINPSVSQ